MLDCVEDLPDPDPGMLLGYEFRLGEDAPAADLALAVGPGTPLAQHFIQRGETAPPGSAAAALARYLAETGRGDSALRDRVAGTMLEFDLVETPAGQRPEPGVFLRLRLGEGSEPHDRPQPLPLAALAGAVGWTDDGALRRSAARVLERRGLRMADYDANEFAWFNAWQPFDHAAVRNPLALLDAASLSMDDIVDYRYTGYGQKQNPNAAAETKSAMPAHSPAHRFYYVSSMATDEVLFFKQLDSRRPGGVCAHTSFDDPASPPDAPPRRSIETRLMAVFA